MIPRRLVLATANRGKAAELAELVCDWGDVEVTTLADIPEVVLPPEVGASYAENAIAKARAVAIATGLPALGDDSGLEVDALAGAPGLTSARYAATDEARIEKLLTALGGVRVAARRARFRCVVALAWPDGHVESAEGGCVGRIADAPAGRGGFGYDPVFVPSELTCTFASATPAEKARLSHRARAVRALGARLRRVG